MTDSASTVREVRKCVRERRPVNEDDVYAGVRDLADIEYQRDRQLTHEQALAKVLAQPVDPYALSGIRSPTWADLLRSAPPSDPVVAAAISKAESDEATAWGELERIAGELRRADPKLSKPASISKAMMTADGQRAYERYTVAQRAGQRARQRAGGLNIAKRRVGL